MAERLTWRCGGVDCRMRVDFNAGGELPFGWYAVAVEGGKIGHICPDCLMLHPDVATMLATEKAAHIAAVSR